MAYVTFVHCAIVFIFYLNHSIWGFLSYFCFFKLCAVFRNLPREFACQVWCTKNRKCDFVVLFDAVNRLVIYAGA